MALNRHARTAAQPAVEGTARPIPAGRFRQRNWLQRRETGMPKGRGWI
ncbi:MAG: hypothetical protein ACE362_19035 [Phaeodactylibacter xiamenensis]|nr:hypothetical protein [Phaeodactylibacter xiamenensis]MCR9055680.1 hypothetical protein [bacterium]